MTNFWCLFTGSDASNVNSSTTRSFFSCYNSTLLSTELHYIYYKVSFNSSGITFAIFLYSLLYVFGHCISVHETGIIFIPDISDLAITTPSSFSAVVTRYPEEASPRLKTLLVKRNNIFVHSYITY